MLRSLTLAALLISGLFLFLPTDTCQGQVNLWNTRNTIANDGASVNVQSSILIIGASYQYDSDSDDEIVVHDTSAFAGLRAEGVTYSHAAWAYAPSTAYAHVNVPSGVVVDGAPALQAYCYPEHEVWANEGYHWMYGWIESSANYSGTALAEAQFTVTANSNDPSAGTDPNSATLTAYVYFVITGELGDSVQNYSLTMDGIVGATNLQVNGWDEVGQVFNVTGTLSDSSSSEPTAPPVVIDDFFYSGMNEEYIGTQATNVGAIVSCRARSTVNSAIGADNVAYYDPSPAEIDMRNNWVHVHYTVYAP
jgi:hypothetical protein